MRTETRMGSEKEILMESYFPMTRIAVAQPAYVREAYQQALTAAIGESYSSRKDFVSPTVHLEEVKSTLVSVYLSQFATFKERGLTPNDFDESFFEFNLKAWVAFMDERQLIQASLDHKAHNEKNRSWSAPEWKPDPDFLKHLAKYLYQSEEVHQKAFFLGNKKGKLFYDSEIEEIRKEMARLDEEAKH